jgi:hypothetical protein
MLVTCLVQTINETDQSFQQRFLERLKAAQYVVRDNPEMYGGGHNEAEMLGWVRELLTGFSRTEGQKQPFLSDYTPT